MNLDINKNRFEVSESTFMYFPKPFNNFNFDKLKIQIELCEGFDVLTAYSYDNKNFSAFKKKHKLVEQNLPVHICIWFQKHIQNDLEKPITMFEINDKSKLWGAPTKIQNVNSIEERCIVNHVEYDGEIIDTYKLSFKTKFDIIDEFPRWNLYDNQQINIQRWLEKCNAIAEMYGHTAIYFKTEPIKKEDINPQSGIHGTHFTLANNVIRNVVDVKKLHILFPNNELPQDRVIFSEWDIGMQDETVIHVVKQKFEQAFGHKSVPNEKDFLYLPIINKLFRVSTMQVKNGFMGVLGWYEVYLSKYVDDESVKKDPILINNELDNTISDVFGFDSKLFGFEPFEYEHVITDELDENLEEVKTDIYSDMTNRIEEEKLATNNLSNRVKDSTFNVSLKETEALREFYDSRLNIISINPGDSVFPIMMYNCNDVEKNQIALNYNLINYTLINKFSTTVKKQLSLTFDFVLMNKNSGTILSLNRNKSKNLDSIIELKIKRNNTLELFDVSTQSRIMFDETPLQLKELYQIVIEYILQYDSNKKIIPIYCIKLFKLNSSRHEKTLQKQLLNQEIYNLLELNPYNHTNFERTVNGLNIFGGNFLLGNINLKIDDNHILDDRCLPLINKNLK